jgi:hypothetical protein
LRDFQRSLPGRMILSVRYRGCYPRQPGMLSPAKVQYSFGVQLSRDRIAR